MGYPQTAVPNTAHSVFYAYSIHVNGVEIGSLENISETSTRTVERIREVMFSRGAEVKEIVWGGTDTSVTMNRVELYNNAILESFGVEIFALEDFTFPVNITEIMQLPEALGGGKRVLTFKDAVAENWSASKDTGTVRIVETLGFAIRVVRGKRTG